MYLFILRCSTEVWKCRLILSVINIITLKVQLQTNKQAPLCKNSNRRLGPFLTMGAAIEIRFPIVSHNNTAVALCQLWAERLDYTFRRLLVDSITGTDIRALNKFLFERLAGRLAALVA